MHIRCTLTGRTLKADGNLFASVTVQTIHPIFQLPTKQLAKLCQQQHLSSDEREALFLALLAKLDTVELVGTVSIPFPKVAKDLPALYLSKLLELLPYVQSYNSKMDLPRFNLCQNNLMAVPAYLAILTDLKQYGRHIPKVLPGDSIELAERLQDARQLAKAASIRKQQDSLTLASVISWAIEALKLSEIRAKLYRQAISKTGGITTDILQDIIGECLDSLPERIESDAIRKQWLLDKLNAIMVDKLALLESLGIDITASTDYLNSVHSTYSIQHSTGATVHNTGTTTGKALASNSTTQVAATASTAQVPRHTSEPVASAYPSTILYLVAMRQWKAQQARTP